MNKAVKATIGLFVVTILSKILGFARETVLVSTYGASMITDAYITSMNIPSVIFAVIGTALATTFIPLYFQVEKNQGKKIAIQFSNNVFNIVIVLSLIMSIIGFFFAEPLTKLFAIDFTGEKLELATQFTRTMIFGMVFIGLSNIMSCILQINGNFHIPGIVGMPYNIIIIVVILISSKGDVQLLAFGTLISMLSQFLFQLPFAYKKGYRYKFHFDIKDEYIKRMMVLIGPVCIGVGVNQLNTIVDRSLASSLGDGIITVLNSANKLDEFAICLFISTISVVIYPMLSKLSVDGEEEAFAEIIKKSMNVVIIFVIPVSIGAIVLAEPIVRLVFERGSFNPQATKLTASALVFYSIGMIGFGLKDILNRVFFSLKDTKTPMINSALSMVINIVLNIILIKFMGHRGLAFATSISSIVCVLFMFNSLGKRVKYFGQDMIMKTMIKCSTSAVLMGVITYFSYKIMSLSLGIGTINEIISILISVLVGAVVYGTLIIIFKVEEIYIILNTFVKKFKSPKADI